jgi:hypothetical protein
MKKNLSVLLVAAAIMTVGVRESAAQWVQTGGPDAKWVSALLVVGPDLLAGTEKGVFVRTDGQDVWTPADPGMARREVRCLVAVGSSVFAGIDWPDLEGVPLPLLEKIKDSVLGAVARSEDGGRTWRPAWSGLPVHTNVMSLGVIGTVLFAGADVNLDWDTAGGVFVSEDGGKSWQDTGSMGSPFIAAAGSALYGDFMLDGFSRSTDGGKTWKPAGKGLPVAAVLCLASFGKSLVVSTNKGLYLSIDDATSWKSTNAGLPPNSAVRRLATEGARFFAATKNAVFVSGNGGQSWVQAGTGLPADVVIWALAATETDLFVGTEGKGVWRLPLAGSGRIGK